MIEISHYASPVGNILIAGRDDKLIAVRIEGQRNLIGALKEEKHENNGSGIIPDTKNWLDRYFAGENPNPKELKISLAGSEFRQRVWRILLEIPYGKVTTYKDIAKIIADEKGIKRMSAQAVGGAVGHNPISVVIPCHRVIGSDGSMIGYDGGIDIKTKLLIHEGYKGGGMHE